ncbi:hypothetical protein P171DRAFT_119158 [Karstenula rhodostoma CBS 690.94]|uniref:Uncharacterized protein n=1 Tax=Karstenula rhodostoma CBS 690.94 TaxID=1392251 RepID=A0A9P4PBV2_9PLEO|nr:hypothetical protein P171DRAFT_119158 [Karstenula rhodostoma CBS 690.94]
MPIPAENVLIDLADLADLASAPLSTTMTAARSTSAESRPAGKMAENDKPRQVSSDSFASLASLMKSKKPWTIATKPPGLVANGPSTPNSPGESSFSTPTSARNYPALRTVSADAAAARQVHHQAPDAQSRLETPISPKSATAENQGYDKATMSKMEEIIAQMSKMVTEAPSEWEIIPDQLVGAQLRQQVLSPSPTLVDVDTLSTPPADGQISPPLSSTPAFGVRTTEDEHIARSKHNESAILHSDNQPVVRCTPQVWDTMINQMKTLKKEKMEAQAKVASLERDWNLRHQAMGDSSSELDELRYRLQLNKDHKAMMNRDMRQKDAELLNKDLEINSLKKQAADWVAMREQCEKLQAEVDYLRTEVERMESDNGQLKQIVTFKDQEIVELKESLAHSKTKMTDHQQRAENLVDTQNTREKKLKRLEKQLSDAQDTEEKLLDKIELLKTEIYPLTMQAKDLDSQLREKTSSCDRMRNDLRHVEKRLEVTSKALHKVENHQQLKGAAHSIVPNDQTKLPKLVLPCLECFARNVTCDASSRCQNCTMSGEKCHRWKCSQVHILRGGCQDFPCLLEHDANGWLMLKQEQPRW